MSRFRAGFPRILPTVFLLFSATGAGAAQPSETRRAQTIAAGVEHIEVRRDDFGAGQKADRWIINVLILDPRSVRLDSALATDEIAGAETTSALAARRGALAAVNGGYFRTTGAYRGEPMGMYAAAGKVLSEPNGPRTEVAGSNAGGIARIAFAQVRFLLSVVAGDGSRRAIDGINRPREKDEIVLFTPEFHGSTLTAAGGWEAAVRSGRISAAPAAGGDLPIPRDGFVLSAAGPGRDWCAAHLGPDASLRLESGMESIPSLPFEPDWILGGGPLLLENGTALGPERADAEGFAADFSRSRHPRTALGIRKDGAIVIAVVDGRQPLLSVGMTIPELAALMAEWGCRDAINLDGGGSTTMVAGGKVVNHPSDAAGERPVSDAILVRARTSPPLDARHFTLK